MSVQVSIASAFSEVPYPGDDCIALHECAECREIRGDFSGKSPQTLEDGVLERRFDSLPLLSSTAFLFFVPAYMLHSLSHPDSLIARFTMYSLAPTDFDDFWRERFRLFTPSQKVAVIAFLEFLKTQAYTTGGIVEGDDEEKRHYEDLIDDGIKIWMSIV
jgi:uncharacterized protein DUF6714